MILKDELDQMQRALRKLKHVDREGQLTQKGKVRSRVWEHAVNRACALNLNPFGTHAPLLLGGCLDPSY